MHYGFAPGTTPQDGRVRALFQRRDQTTLVHRRGMSTVRDFIQHLATATTGVVRPIDDALLGAHANSEGQVFIPLFRGQRGPTIYESLEAALASAANSIAIPDATIGYTAGNSITHALHFKGCNIGQARPFLLKLKQAAGNHVKVTAPLHFHGITTEPAYGVFEYLCYEFIIRRDRDFPDRAAAVAAFQAGGFRFIGGSAVPAAHWSGRGAPWHQPWIPARIARTTPHQLRAPLGVTIGARSTIAVPQQFRVDRTPFVWTIAYPNAASVPSGAGPRRTALETSLTTDNGRPNPAGPSRFSASHPYPWFRRLGYATFLDFMNGYVWSFTRQRANLVCRGTRTEYTVVVPVTDIATGNLIFNFHPNAGSTHPRRTGMLETNATLFATV